MAKIRVILLQGNEPKGLEEIKALISSQQFQERTLGAEVIRVTGGHIYVFERTDGGITPVLVKNSGTIKVPPSCTFEDAADFVRRARELKDTINEFDNIFSRDLFGGKGRNRY